MELNEIKNGESRTLEFKKELPQDSSKWIKTIVAFANGAGGKLNVIEGWGTGLKRIIDFCKEKNVEPPVFEEIGDLLRVNFYRPSYKKSAINDSKNAQIGDKSAINQKNGDKSAITNEDKIIEYLKTHKNAKSQEIADYIGLKISRTKDYLSKLVEEGKIEAIGGNKNRTYVLRS